MPSTARLPPLPGEDYERKCIELGIIRRAKEETGETLSNFNFRGVIWSLRIGHREGSFFPL
jgi:hypothetical protein